MNAYIHNSHAFVVHFSPFDPLKGANELRLILAHAGILPQSERKLIVDDFNAFVRSGLNHYREVLFGDMIKKDKPCSQQKLNEGSLDYSAISFDLDMQ